MIEPYPIVAERVKVTIWLARLWSQAHPYMGGFCSEILSETQGLKPGKSSFLLIRRWENRSWRRQGDQKRRDSSLHKLHGRNAHPSVDVKQYDYRLLFIDERSFILKGGNHNSYIFNEHLSKCLLRSLAKMREQCRWHKPVQKRIQRIGFFRLGILKWICTLDAKLPFPQWERTIPLSTKCSCCGP